MGLSLLALTQTGARRYAPRRVTAVIASFTVLCQAMLFAWHHHLLPFASPSASATLAAAPEIPAFADHDCDICFVLGHHGVIPIDLFAAVRPPLAPLRPFALATVFGFLAPYLLFHSRAPPPV